MKETYTVNQCIEAANEIRETLYPSKEVAEEKIRDLTFHCPDYVKFTDMEIKEIHLKGDDKSYYRPTFEFADPERYEGSLEQLETWIDKEIVQNLKEESQYLSWREKQVFFALLEADGPEFSPDDIPGFHANIADVMRKAIRGEAELIDSVALYDLEGLYEFLYRSDMSFQEFINEINDSLNEFVGTRDIYGIIDTKNLMGMLLTSPNYGVYETRYGYLVYGLDLEF